MKKYEVTCELVVTCRVKIIVDAEDNDAAISAAVNQLPHHPHGDPRWSGKIDIKPPKGVKLESVEPFHFRAAAGGEKARAIKAKA